MRNVTFVPVALAALLLFASGCAQSNGPATTAPATSSPMPSSTAATTSAATTSPTGDGSQAIRLFFDFGGETEGSGDLSGWTPKSDVPLDPNRPGSKVAWNVTACDDAAYEDHVHIQYHPVHSACFYLDGRQDDGTVWISRVIPVAAGRPYLANVTVKAFGQESFNTVADIVVRLGHTGAATEADFATGTDGRHASVRQPLDTANGWTTYFLEWEAGRAPANEFVLDIGISAIWETEMTRYLDAVTVTLVPQ